MFDAVWILTLCDADSIQGIQGVFKTEDAARTAMYDMAEQYLFVGERNPDSFEVSTPVGFIFQIEEFSVKG